MTFWSDIKNLKLLLLGKAFLLFIACCYYFNLFQIAEKKALGQDEAHNKSQETLDSSDQIATEEVGSNEENQKKSGLLDGLLKVEPLDTKDLQKDEIGKYLSIIEQARQQIDDRMQVLQGKAKDLEEIEKSISEKLKKLEEEQQFFTSTLQKEKEIQEDRLKSLIELYGKMEPKKAAQIFESIDQDLMVALFNKMKIKQVGKIVEAMSPEKAKKATEYYGRVGSAREWQILQEVNKSLRQEFAEKCLGLPKKAT